MPSAEPVNQAAFRAAAGRFATGITVVTTVLDGIDHAMTANAFTSVSLEPPLVLVCVEKATRFHDAVLAAGSWAVSVLDASAQDAAVWFATKGRPLEGQLQGYAHGRGRVTGAALLASALSHLECRTWASYDGGDHTIVVGEVLALQTAGTPADALVYFRSGYLGLGGFARPS